MTGDVTVFLLASPDNDLRPVNYNVRHESKGILLSAKTSLSRAIKGEITRPTLFPRPANGVVKSKNNEN